MLGKRFQRTTSMTQIGSNACNALKVDTEEQQPCAAHEPISHWEILKHAEEMMMMMMAAAGGQKDATAPPETIMSGGQAEAASFYQSERPSELIPRVNFLDNCFFCKRRLKHERDIFIYRGDAAFCTEECRQRQILEDESHSTGASKRGSAATSETAVAA